MTIEMIRQFEDQVLHPGGVAYTAHVCGRARADERWEGWIEFLPDRPGPVLRSPRETIQPNRFALVHWASNLPATHLTWSLERAHTTERRAA